MGIFPFLLPILFNHGGSDPIRRCSRCGEPITRLGKFSDRHPVIAMLTFMLLVAIVTCAGLNYMGWTIHRGFPSLCKPNECETYVGYCRQEWKDFLDQLHHIW